MKIISWNVNGVRAVIKKGFKNFLTKTKPDIVCLQEIKIDDNARAKEKFDFSGYEEYWCSAKRPGYSGTAILIKSSLAPLVKEVKNGLGKEEFDQEGRVQTLVLKDFYLLNAYFPHINHEFTRLDYKLRFNQAFSRYVKNLEKKKKVIAAGDFNVAHEEIDLARPQDNIGNPGFTDEERAWMGKFLGNGFVDTFRYFNPKVKKYSWWSYRFQARERNIGWRIDYFCVSTKLIKLVKEAFILDNIQGSDHAPVGIFLKNK